MQVPRDIASGAKAPLDPDFEYDLRDYVVEQIVLDAGSVATQFKGSRT